MKNSCQGNTASYSHGNTKVVYYSVLSIRWIGWIDYTLLNLQSVWDTKALTFLLVGVANYNVHFWNYMSST